MQPVRLELPIRPMGHRQMCRGRPLCLVRPQHPVRRIRSVHPRNPGHRTILRRLMRCDRRILLDLPLSLIHRRRQLPVRPQRPGRRMSSSLPQSRLRSLPHPDGAFSHRRKRLFPGAHWHQRPAACRMSWLLPRQFPCRRSFGLLRSGWWSRVYRRPLRDCDGSVVDRFSSCPTWHQTYA